MKYAYTSVFVAASYLPHKRGQKNYVSEVNGVEFTRDVQATIEKMAEDGYEFHQSIPLISAAYYHKTYTEGATLIFRKEIRS